MSGSSHPKLVGDWLAEFDCAASMDDLDHSGFTFDSNQTEFETLNSETVDGFVSIIPAGWEALQRKSDYACGLADYVAVLSLFDINKTQGWAVGSTDLLNIALCNDNLKQLNEADEEMLPNLHDGHVERSSIVKHDLSLYHTDIFLKKEPKTWWVGQNQLISLKERSRDGKQHQHMPQGTFKEKAKIEGSWTSKGSCLKGSTCSFDPQRKGKAKD